MDSIDLRNVRFIKEHFKQGLRIGVLKEDILLGGEKYLQGTPLLFTKHLIRVNFLSVFFFPNFDPFLRLDIERGDIDFCDLNKKTFNLNENVVLEVLI